MVPCEVSLRGRFSSHLAKDRNENGLDVDLILHEILDRPGMAKPESGQSEEGKFTLDLCWNLP